MSANKPNQSSDDSIIIFLLFFGLIVFALIYFQSDFKYVRYSIYEYYIKGLKFVLDFLGFQISQVNEYHDLLTVYEPKEISNDKSLAISNFARLLIALPLGLILFLVYRKILISKRYRQTYTRNTLIESQKERWKHLYIVSSTKTEENLEKGDFAMSKRPLDFCAHHGLLNDEDKVIEGSASVVFSLQLGKLFSTFEEMEPHEQALMCIFALYSTASQKNFARGQRYFDILNVSHANKKPDYSWVPEIWKEVKNLPDVQIALKEHAYNRTILMRMFELAKKIVISTSQFIWLKPLDRVLFFSLNNIGRLEAFTECAGVFNHFLAEKMLNLNTRQKRKLYTSYTNNAVDGLKQAIDNTLITDANYSREEN